MTELLFLLSDSRSGSTFLSRTLHNAFDNLVVTPELSLFWAVKCLNKGKRDRSSLIIALERGRFFETLDIRSELFPEETQITDEIFAKFVRDSLAAFAERKWPQRKVEKVVVKKGHHIWVAQSLKRLFPEAQFICLYRDPRAVYESKQRTERPYFPGETMGWGGVALTTYRWCQYTQAMLNLEKKFPSQHVQFETLAQDEELILSNISRKLQLDISKNTQNDYLIRRAELNVHSRSVENKIETESMDEWKTKLSDRDIRIIEFVAADSMLELGYEKISGSNRIQSRFETLASLTFGLFAMTRKFIVNRLKS